MPYRRYRRRMRKRQKPSRWGIYKSAGKQLWRDVMYLKSVVNVEKKYIDVTNTVNPSTTSAFVLLNGVAQGTTGTTRTGISIKNVFFLFRGTLEINTAATETQVRVVILKDSIPQAALPSSGDVFAVANSITSPLNLLNNHRFRVFYDKLFSLSINGPETFHWKWMRKLHFHSAFNNVNAGTIADYTGNSFLLYYVSDEATNTPALSYYSRVRFIDN